MEGMKERHCQCNVRELMCAAIPSLLSVKMPGLADCHYTCHVLSLSLLYTYIYTNTHTHMYTYVYNAPTWNEQHPEKSRPDFIKLLRHNHGHELRQADENPELQPSLDLLKIQLLQEQCFERARDGVRQPEGTGKQEGGDPESSRGRGPSSKRVMVGQFADRRPDDTRRVEHLI
jgi:hypothetical protein